MAQDRPVPGIPMPIVTLNRTATLAGVVLAAVLRQPLILTALFAILAPAALFGARASLVYWIGTRAFAKSNETAEREDRRLMRFNNCLAVLMLGAAQICFLLNYAILGWAFAGAVAAAAAVALCGFCVGCFLFFRLKMARYRLFGA